MRRKKMEEKVTAGDPKDAKTDERKLEDPADQPPKKTRRKRVPSKRLLESADTEKEKVRKPRKQPSQVNGVKSTEESGHVTRRRSRSPRPAKEAADKTKKDAAEKKTKPAARVGEEEKGGTKTKRTVKSEGTKIKKKGKKDEVVEGDPKPKPKEEKTSPMVRKRKADPDDSDARPLKKIRKSGVKKKPLANGDVTENMGADQKNDSPVKDTCDVPALSSKSEQEKVPEDSPKVKDSVESDIDMKRVPPKKRQRKKPVEAEGHILLNSKKPKKNTKLNVDSTGNISKGITYKDPPEEELVTEGTKTIKASVTTVEDNLGGVSLGQVSQNACPSKSGDSEHASETVNKFGTVGNVSNTDGTMCSETSAQQKDVNLTDSNVSITVSNEENIVTNETGVGKSGMLLEENNAATVQGSQLKQENVKVKPKSNSGTKKKLVKEEKGENADGAPVKEKKKRVKKVSVEGKEGEGEGTEKKKRQRKTQDGEPVTKRPVMCEKCGFIATSKTALKKHDNRCHNEDNEDFVKDNPFKCSICEYRAKKLSVIKRHVKKHGLEMCRYCEFVAENKVLESHVRSEHGKMVKCKKCHRKISNDEDFEQHVENCQGQRDGYKCPHCDKEFKYKSLLKVHEITHDASLPKRFSCEHCSYQSHFKANLQKHIESKHSGERQRSIPCPICQNLYYSETSMKKHMKNHSEERPHQCSECDKSFKRSFELKNHMLTHDPNDPFKCEMEGCERTFKYEKLLKAHLLDFHKQVERKLKCSHEGCDVVFMKKGHLRRHEATHSGDRKFLCTWPDCGKAFRHADNLKVHYRQHTNEKPIQCTLCSFACRQRNSLSWHMKRYHNPQATTKTEKSKDKTDSVDKVKLSPEHDEVSNHSTDSSATIEITTTADLGSLADVSSEPGKTQNDTKEPDTIVEKTQTNDGTDEKPVKKEKKPTKKKQIDNTDKESKPKTEKKPRKPRAKKVKATSEPFQNVLNGAIETEQTCEEQCGAATCNNNASSQEVPGSGDLKVEEKSNEKGAVGVEKPKRKRKRKDDTDNPNDPPKKRKRTKKNDTKPENDTQAEDAAKNEESEDFVDRSYPYKEKRPPKGQRLLNPDKMKDVCSDKKQNVYDFDSEDEARGSERKDERSNSADTLIEGEVQNGQVSAESVPVLNHDDGSDQTEINCNVAPSMDVMGEKSVQARMLSDVVVTLSPLDLAKIDRRELLDSRDDVQIPQDPRGNDATLKDGITASDIEQDVREIIEKDGVCVTDAPPELTEDAQIFVDNGEEFPDRSDGEIIDRHLLQKYLEDTSMDGFERDLMKDEEKAAEARNQFDNYVSPERQPMSAQPMKAEGQFDNYMSPEQQPMSVQPLQPEGQYDKYVSPEQVLSNQSVVNHDTMSLPSNASQHGESQWKVVEPSKSSVIAPVEGPWTGPLEPEKRLDPEPRIFDPYSSEKQSSVLPTPLPEKAPYSDIERMALDPGRESSAYRIPDYGSMYDPGRMLSSGLSGYPPVSVGSDPSLSISRPSTSFDPKEVSSLGYAQSTTPYLQSSGYLGSSMNPPSNSYIDPRVDPYPASQLPSTALQARDNPLNSLAMSASKYIESEINKTRVYNQQGWTLQETQSLRLTHSLFPNRNQDWDASSRPSSTYSYLSDREMAGYNACPTGRPPPLSDRLSAGYLSGQTAESLEKQALERYDMANYLNSRHTGLPQPPSFNFDRQITPLASSAKAFTDPYRGPSSIADYRGLSHATPPDLYAPNLGLDKYFYTRDGMYGQRVSGLSSESPFLSQPGTSAQANFAPRDYTRSAMYSQPGPYALMDNSKYSDPGKFAQPISSMQGRDLFMPRPGSATGHIQDPYRPPMLYNMMNRYFE